MRLALLDTDTLSEILKGKHALVAHRAALYLHQHQQFAFSAITRFEILRGLKSKGATTQVVKFKAFCSQSLILTVTDPVLDRAADLWAAAIRSGQPANDADLIIAATALEYGRVLITSNTKHFAWIPGLVIEDWRQP